MDDCHLVLEARKKNRAIFNDIKVTIRMFSEVGYSYAKRQINLKLYWLGMFLFCIFVFFFNLILEEFISFSLLISFFASGVVYYLIWRFKISKHLTSVEDYIDSLLSEYTPNDKEAFDTLVDKVKTSPDEFLSLVRKWVELEVETYRKRDLIKKDYKFIRSNKV
ncbi:hypothetical protein [Providencia rettgeri]|uniref:hypothetical protein n=1 Tax=Providencia rettgeri TaxID=587 RepID=UPI0024BA9605|nr:hypothetical protein [Providencia rettgeri]WHT81909.1 hypothetical protein KOL65_21985 [Providencia rettgeri]